MKELLIFDFLENLQV